MLSVILSGVVCLLLSAHLLFHHADSPNTDELLEGRTFIVAELTLFGLIALEALIFSKIEDWTFLDGVFFTVTTMLSIGFGNYSPSQTSTKVLLFPFTILGIALLSNQVSLIASVSSKRNRLQKNRFSEWSSSILDARRRSSSDVHNGSKMDKKSQSLIEEVERLRRMVEVRQNASEVFDLFYSILLLVIFWFVGGAIYHVMEGWSFGNAMYFSYIFFLTIGYGDFAPSTPAGKSVFVIWALMAVPIMTNFVVQTIQTIVTRFSMFLAKSSKEKRIEWENTKNSYFIPHIENVSTARKNILNIDQDARTKTDISLSIEELSAKGDKAVQELNAINKSPRSKNSSDLDFLDSNNRQSMMVDRKSLLDAFDLAAFLEAQGRALLLDELPEGSTKWLLFQADTNNQISHLDSLGSLDSISWRNELVQSLQGDNEMERIRKYRETYAKFLVNVSQILCLDGKEQLAWERRNKIFRT